MDVVGYLSCVVKTWTHFLDFHTRSIVVSGGWLFLSAHWFSQRLLISFNLNRNKKWNCKRIMDPVEFFCVVKISTPFLNFVPEAWWWVWGYWFLSSHWFVTLSNLLFECGYEWEVLLSKHYGSGWVLSWGVNIWCFVIVTGSMLVSIAALYSFSRHPVVSH